MSRKSTPKERGFTIIELLVSMVIFLIVTASIYGVLSTAQLSRGVVSNQVQLTKSVRMGLNLVGRDTYNAGYGYPLKNAVILQDNRISTRLGIPADVDTSRDTVPPIIAGNNITTNTFSETANTKTDQVTYLFKDSDFNVAPGTGVSVPLNVTATTVSGIDEVTIVGSTNASCNINDLFLFIGKNGGATLGLATGKSGTNKMLFATGDVLGFNQPGTSGALRFIEPVSMYRVKMVTYFVTSDGVLTRREFANVPPASPAVPHNDEPLVYGVEDFQIKYVMDDGTLLDNPSAGPDGIAGNSDDDQFALAAIRQVRFTVRVRTTETDWRNRTNKVTMTATYSTRNLGYEAN
jgi:prepilin-type N-terminal cleavage/methylation domain-containing protein